jgi:transcription initiation factor TFIIIB Brf1 subunit/transcription initiation factor TFIIB
VCSKCNRRGTLRVKQSEGTIVCGVCGHVESKNNMDMSKEFRNFGHENNGENPDHYGNKLSSID